MKAQFPPFWYTELQCHNIFDKQYDNTAFNFNGHTYQATVLTKDPVHEHYVPAPVMHHITGDVQPYNESVDAIMVTNLDAGQFTIFYPRGIWGRAERGVNLLTTTVLNAIFERGAPVSNKDDTALLNQLFDVSNLTDTSKYRPLFELMRLLDRTQSFTKFHCTESNWLKTHVSRFGSTGFVVVNVPDDNPAILHVSASNQKRHYDNPLFAIEFQFEGNSPRGEFYDYRDNPIPAVL